MQVQETTSESNFKIVQRIIQSKKEVTKIYFFKTIKIPPDHIISPSTSATMLMFSCGMK